MAYADWASGTHYWTVPANVYSVKVQGVGGGGGGSGGSDGGYVHNGPGGYGGYAGTSVSTKIAVTPGSVLTIIGGAGGAGGIQMCCLGVEGSSGGASSVSGGSSYVSMAGGAGGPTNLHCNDGVTSIAGGGDTYYAATYNSGTDTWTCPNGGTLTPVYGEYGTTYMCQLTAAIVYNTGTYGQNSTYGTGGAPGGVSGYNQPGRPGGYGAGGGGGGMTVGTDCTVAPGGAGGSGYVRIDWNAVAPITPPTVGDIVVYSPFYADLVAGLTTERNRRGISMTLPTINAGTTVTATVYNQFVNCLSAANTNGLFAIPAAMSIGSTVTSARANELSATLAKLNGEVL